MLNGENRFPPGLQVRLPQPIPKSAAVNYYRVPGRVISSIVRTWAPGDTQRCRLCPACCAIGNVCLITVGTYIPVKDVAMYSVVGLPRQDELLGRSPITLHFRTGGTP